jgi:predicted nicotinamide N-methyase
MCSYTRYLPEISVAACGRSWTLRRPAALEEMWDAMGGEEFGADERLPYWVELWPASLALAEWLFERRDAIAGTRCLDLGCGLGLTAMVASWLGARVLAVDYEPEALFFARENAALNGVPQPLWTVMDWRRPAVAAGGIDHIWGGDVMYERRFALPVLSFLNHALAPGGRAWLAEPGRDVYDHFRAALVAGGWASRLVRTARVEALYVQPSGVGVKLWELTKN